MRSCFPSWLLLCSLSPLGFYTPFVIAPESGAGKLQLRFIACVSHSVFFGFPTRLPSSLIYEIRGLSCITHLILFRCNLKRKTPTPPTRAHKCPCTSSYLGF